MDKVNGFSFYPLDNGVSMEFLRRYPFRGMELGQSFFVPVKEKTSRQVSCAAYYYSKQTGMTFKVKKEGGGTRVWRIT